MLKILASSNTSTILSNHVIATIVEEVIHYIIVIYDIQNRYRILFTNIYFPPKESLCIF